MKITSFFTLLLIKGQLYRFLLLMIPLLTCNIYGKSENFAIFLSDSGSSYCSPDTIPMFTEGDTIETYLDGESLVYVLFEDTSATQDSIEMLLWEFTDNQPHILIEFSDNAAPIQQGLYGFNVGNIFLPGHAYEPEFELAYGEDPTPFDLLSALKPNVLRFPAGQSSTFMQPLGSNYTSDPLDDNYGNLNGGYGYDIESMIRYYDMTDGTGDVLDPPMDMPTLLTTLETDIYGVPAGCDDCDEWMTLEAVKDFTDKYRLWHDQVNFDPGILTYEEMPDLYINDFILLIKKIEDDNPGHVVDVIYCADILNQTADDVVQVISYLLDNTIYDVHVVGVELGNEVYAPFFASTIGFTTSAPDEVSLVNDFEHYWDYINGGEYSGLTGWSTSELEYVMPDDVEMDHNFISRLKITESTEDIKIGLPATPHRACDEFIFINDDPRDDYEAEFLSEPCPYPQWNIDLATYYSEEIEEHYAFDAVIIHNYISPKGSSYAGLNYMDIILPPDDNCLDGDYDFDVDIVPYTDGVWDYEDMDERLECAYYGLIGLGNLPGNFHQDIKTNIEDAQEDHANYLHFLATDDGPEVKEQWVTESSVSTDLSDEFEDIKPYIGVVANSFLQAYVTQEWILKNVKMNFIGAARDNFFTYNTQQNFLGGVPTDFMTPTDKQDQLELGVVPLCTTAIVDNHYAPRITYHDMTLVKEIFNGDYQYLKTTTTMYSGNPNLPPTVFIMPSENKILVAYTNVRPTTQTYYLDPNEVTEFYGDLNVSLNDNPISIYYIKADQLYSSSGKCSIFDINNFYNTCSDSYLNRFEITSTSSETNTGTCSGGWGVTDGVCVKVPANSIGYFIIDVEPYMRLGAPEDMFKIYPNPSSTYFTLLNENPEFNTEEDVKIDVYSAAGAFLTFLLVFIYCSFRKITYK